MGEKFSGHVHSISLERLEREAKAGEMAQTAVNLELRFGNNPGLGAILDLFRKKSGVEMEIAADKIILWNEGK